MSDTEIFWVGCFVSLLCFIFTFVTINEFQEM
jgi:hypothetical protein